MEDPAGPPVRLYNQILIWPLQLRGTAFTTGGVDQWSTAIVDHVDNRWIRLDLYERGYGEDDARYAEFAYFHPFVRDILFTKTVDGLSSVALLGRSDVTGVNVQLYPSHKPVQFRVERVHLYLFETRVAVLVVEILHEERLTLPETEDLLDTFRRAYTPYFAHEEKEKVRAHCPHRVQWIHEVGKPIGDVSDYEAHSAHSSFVRAYREAPMSKHWSDLLSPLTPWRGKNDVSALAARQLHDERIPTMVLLAFDDPISLRDGDWVRLCHLDERGDSPTLPYSKSCCQGFEAKHCYDRFWDPVVPARKMSTRYLTAGYSFVVVGKCEYWSDDQGNQQPGFCIDGKLGGLMHFRHHYFQIGLLLFMQYASLMAFWDRLSDVNDTEKAVMLQRDFARFTSRFWFTELSSHLQAQELHQLWSEHLGVRKLYEEVHREIQFVGETFRGIEADRLTSEAAKLNKLALQLAPLALVLGFFGMNAVVQSWDGWDFTPFRGWGYWIKRSCEFVIVMLWCWIAVKVVGQRLGKKQ